MNYIEKLAKLIDRDILLEAIKIKPIKWRKPTDKELEDEFHEREIQDLFFSGGYDKQEDLDTAWRWFKKNLREREINVDDLDDSNSWRFKFKDYKSFRKRVTGYGSPKDPDSMIRGIQVGQELPMPVVVLKADGKYLLAGGATRTSIAGLAGQPIKALVIKETTTANLRAYDIENWINDYVNKSDDPKTKELNDRLKDYENLSNDDIDKIGKEYKKGLDGKLLSIKYKQLKKFDKLSRMAKTN